MYIEALFTIAKMWKHPKCLSTDDWIKKVWYMYIFVLVLSHSITSDSLQPFGQ